MAGIKALDLDPTKENIYKTLMDDAVGRNKNLWQFACFCSAQESRCSIALDSGWGTGKTFFLKQLEMLFNCFDLEESKQRAIEKVFSEYRNSNVFDNKLKPHTCICYDAWMNDNAEDPMRSLLYEIIIQTDKCICEKKQVRLFFKKQAFSPSVMDLIETLCKALDGITPMLQTGRVVPFLEYIKKNDPVREIDAQKRFQNAFENYLNKVLKEKDKRLLVMIDELDRCKPTYAVQLLERIKHYLSNDRITFVFAINEEQLQHTVNAIYGDGFEAHQYLDRFFDFRFSLPQPDYFHLRRILRIDNLDENTWMYKSVCEAVIDKYSLSIREAIKYCQWVRIICNIYADQIANDTSFTLKLIIYIIIPIIYGLKIKDIDTLNMFLEGKDISPMKAIFENPRLRIFLRHPGISYENTKRYLPSIDDDNSVPSLINDVYYALFQTPEDESFPRRTPTFCFDKQAIEILYQAFYFMTDFIKYDTNTEETAHG